MEFGTETENNSTEKKKTKKWVTSQVALAEVLGVDRKTIKEWLKMPGTPGKAKDDRYNVEDWREWQSANSYKTGDENVDTLVPEDGDTIVALKQRLMRAQAEKVEIENKVRKGELISEEEVCRVVVDAFAGMVSSLRQTKHRVSSQMSGLDSGTASKVLGKDMEDCLRKWALGEWAKKKPFYQSVYATLRDLHGKFCLGNGLNET